MKRLTLLLALLAPMAFGSDIGRQSPCYMSGAFVDCYQPVEHTSMEGPSSSSVSGYLASTDWATFNGKGTGTVTTVTGTAPVVSSGGTTPAISMAQSNATTNGFLASTDWATFNGKDQARTVGNLTEATSAVLTFSNGSGAVIGSGTTIQVTKSDATHPGYLASADWATFNGKDQARTVGNLTEATSAVLTFSNGSGAVIGSGTTIQVTQASLTASGYLTSGDWAAFNGGGRVKATTTTNGYLASGDWAQFNNANSGTYTPTYTRTGDTFTTQTHNWYRNVGTVCVFGYTVTGGGGGTNTTTITLPIAPTAFSATQAIARSQALGFSATDGGTMVQIEGTGSSTTTVTLNSVGNGSTGLRTQFCYRL